MSSSPSSMAVALAEAEHQTTPNCFFCNNLQFEHTIQRLRGRALPVTAHPLTVEGHPDNYSVTIPARYLLRDGWHPRKDKDLEDCRYCQFLHDALNLFFTEPSMNWITDSLNGWDGSLTVSVQEGFPLILHCPRVISHDGRWVRLRADIQVFCHDRSALSTGDLPSMHLALPEEEEAVDTCGFRGFIRSNMQVCGFAPDRMTECHVLPKRLLQVDWDAQEIKLLHPRLKLPGRSPITAYATLSHCWSEADPYLLNLEKSNLREWMRGVSLDHLPQAMYDAVEVAHAHDIRYLWIECLCIVQDDDDDLGVEMLQVGAYFRHSAITIVAASSASPMDSFLYPYRAGWINKQLDFTAPSGGTATVHLRRKESHQTSPLDAAADECFYRSERQSFRRVGPLYGQQRCYQEALLGTRVVSFTSEAITIDCRLHSQCEKGTNNDNGFVSNNVFAPMFCAWEHPAVYRQLPAHRRFGPNPQPGVLRPRPGPAAMWLQAVMQYTARRMAVSPKHKLLAISGLASLSPMPQESQYVAGLWRIDLHQGLLWELKLRTEQTNATRITLPFKHQRAPSFSWASVDAGVYYMEPWQGVLVPDAEILEARSTPKIFFDPFSDVDGAFLKLRGCLITCQVIQTISGPASDTRGMLTVARFHMKPKAGGGVNGPTTKEVPFVADGALIVARGPKCHRHRHRSRKQKESKPKLVSELVEWWCVDHLSRNHADLRRKALKPGQTTISSPAYVFCIGKRGGGRFDPVTNRFEHYSLEGLVVTPSLRHRGAYERIGCLRGIPVAAYEQAQRLPIGLV